MHCSELERHLEACLDGQLGDGRRTALLQHLRLCRRCSERVEALRRFEADLQRRLRAMQHEASLWQPLGLEMVGDSRPAEPAGAAEPAVPRLPRTVLPPRRMRRPTAPGPHRLRRAEPAARPPGRRLQGLLGVTLLLAAAAALGDFVWNLMDGRSPGDAYRAYLAGEVELDLLTAEPEQLASWLGERLGEPVDLPLAPGAYTLVGGTAGSDIPGGAGLAVYATEAGPAVLSIATAGERLAATLEKPTLESEGGLTSMSWRTGEHAYSLVSALPPDKLALFAVP